MPIPSRPSNEAPLSAKELVYRTLLEWIIDGTLQPGERISDTEIAAYFSRSRTPVREALQLLADQRLVDIFPGRESRVSSIDPQQVKSNYRLMGKLNAIAMEFCAPKMAEEQLEKLRRINEKMELALGRKDYRTGRQLDWEFHFVFFDLADNYFLLNAAQNLYTHCIRIENLYFSQNNDFSGSLRLHDQILAALEVERFVEAGNLLTQNWTDTVKELEYFLP